MLPARSCQSTSIRSTAVSPAARQIIAACLFASAVISSVAIADVTEFRGPNRSGVYTATGDLLSSWPSDGPKQLWSVDGLGEGYSHVTVADGKVYVTGMKDLQGTVHAFDTKGNKLWQKNFGKEHSGSGYPGSRTTPTVDSGHLYLLSSNGKAVALDAKTGDVRWSRDLLTDFAGKNIYFGVSESPLVVDDMVIYTPGGKDASVVALSKTDGTTVWQSKGLSETAAYCSPVLYEHGKQRQILTFTAKHLVGIDADSGEVKWRHPVEVAYDIHANSPVIMGRQVFLSHGYDQGSLLVEIAEDGNSVKQVWQDDGLDVHHGGAVAADDRFYGAASNKTWYALDAKTGMPVAEARRLGKGAVVYADGMLYGYTEAGKVLLVDPAGLKVVSSFKVSAGDGHHWAHPVIDDGVLYIRHGDVLIAYDIAAKAGS